jgi:hypothetical protein
LSEARSRSITGDLTTNAGLNVNTREIDDGRGRVALVRFWPSSSGTGAVEVEPGFVIGALILIFALLIIFDK